MGTSELSFDKSFTSSYRGNPEAALSFIQSETNAVGEGVMADIRSGVLAVPKVVSGLEYKKFLINKTRARYSNQTPGLQYTFIAKIFP